MPNSGADSNGKRLVGVGIDINLSKNFAVALNDYGYISPNLDSGSGIGGNTNVVLAGLKYNF